MKRILICCALCLFLLPVTAQALDYKVWIPLLPDTLDGMARSGEPDGMNMEMGGQQWSSVNQEYVSEDGKRSVQLSVVAGMGSSQVQAYQGMAGMSMQMETGDETVKSINVSGHKAILTLDKKAKTGTLIIPLKNDMVVVLEADQATDEAHLTRLTQQLPLAEFAAAR